MEYIILKIVNLSLAAGVIVVVVILGRLLLNRVLKTPKWVSCLLWIIVALRLVIPWTPATPFGILPAGDIVSLEKVSVVQKNVPETPVADTAEIPVISTGLTYMNDAINEELAESMMPAIGASVDPIQVVLYVGAIVWIAGAAAMLIYAIVSWSRVRRRVREAVPFEKGVFEVDNLGTPFILGLFRPVIYIPAGLDEKSLQAVLAHERAHLSRRDHLWKPFGFLLLTIYWFNPLIWVAYVLLCRDIEMACDEKVVTNMEAEWKKDYSETLLLLSVPRRMITVCPVAFGEVGVKDRIKNVLNYKRPAFWITIVAIVTCAVLAVVLLTGRANKGSKVNIYAQYFSNENDGAAYRDVENVKKFLKALPAKAEDLENEGILVSRWWGDKNKSKEIWNKFADNVNKKEPAVLTVAAFTDEGDPIFTYVYYDGTKYCYGRDNTRDKFGSPQEVTLKLMDYLYTYTPDDGSFNVKSTNNEGMTYSEFLEMIASYEEYQDELSNTADVIVAGDATGWKTIDGTPATADAADKEIAPFTSGLVGWYSIYVFIPIGESSYRYEILNSETGDVKKAEHLYKCIEKTDFDGVYMWDFYSLEEYPGLEVILGTNGEESMLFGYAPSQRIPEQDITDVVNSAEFVVMENGSVVSGKAVWEKFLDASDAGQSASVNIASVYRERNADTANDLSLATREDFPCMYCNRLTYDGSQYIIEPINKIDGEYSVYERKGIDSPAASYKYLMHYTGKPRSQTALFTSFDKYVLTNDDTLTWDDIEKCMYSSQAGVWIAHEVVYNEYEWK